MARKWYRLSPKLPVEDSYPPICAFNVISRETHVSKINFDLFRNPHLIDSTSYKQERNPQQLFMIQWRIQNFIMGEGKRKEQKFRVLCFKKKCFRKLSEQIVSEFLAQWSSKKSTSSSISV